MKWTQENKEKAIEMLKRNEPISNIAKQFSMSNASVSLLKYSNVVCSDERIICGICKKSFKQITVNHLLKEHNISLENYKIKYPDSKISTGNPAECPLL